MKRAAVLLSLAFASSAAAAPARTFDIVGYTPPDGWKLESSGDHEVLTTIDQGHGWYFMVAVYKGHAAAGDLAASFRAEWTDIVASQVKGAEAVPQPTLSPLHDGLNAAAGAGTGTMGDKPVVALLFTLDGGAQVASVLVLAPSADALKAYSSALKTFLGGVTLKKGGGGDAPAPAPAPAAGKTITMADLAGTWQKGMGLTTDYVNGSGQFVTSRTDVGVTKYIIQASGSYKMEFRAIMNNKYVKEDVFGHVELSGGFISFVPDKGNVEKYHFIDWKESDEGYQLTLLSAVYPIEPGYMLYKEVYGRYKPGHEPPPKK